MKFGTKISVCLVMALMVSGCGDDAPSAAQDGTTNGSARSGEAREVVQEFVDGLNLSGPIPPGGCELLTEERASDILGGDVRKRPGGGDVCTFVRGSGDDESMVRLLITSFPLESIKVTDNPMKIALTLQGWATAKESLTQVDDFGDKPAFTALEDGTSVVWLVPGVNTTSVTSDTPIGEVVVQASLKSSAPHEERLATLKGLARETQAFLGSGK